MARGGAVLFGREAVLAYLAILGGLRGGLGLVVDGGGGDGLALYGGSGGDGLAHYGGGGGGVPVGGLRAALGLVVAPAIVDTTSSIAAVAGAAAAVRAVGAASPDGARSARRDSHAAHVCEPSTTRNDSSSGNDPTSFRGTSAACMRGWRTAGGSLGAAEARLDGWLVDSGGYAFV